MREIIYLLPPSEGKSPGGDDEKECSIFDFQKPLEIAKNATEKDLKCKGKRYAEGILLNKSIEQGPFCSAIERYNGVMFKAIDYLGLGSRGTSYFDEYFLILSGMYGIVKPQDKIGNYKLPIDTKGLKSFWGTKITDTLQELNAEKIVNLLPLSYQKMIDFSMLDSQIIHVNFFHHKDGERKKMTHGVKKVKGQWIHQLCEQGGLENIVKGNEREVFLDIEV